MTGGGGESKDQHLKPLQLIYISSIGKYLIWRKSSTWMGLKFGPREEILAMTGGGGESQDQHLKPV